MPALQFQTLIEAPELPRFELPPAIADVYGTFGLPDRVRYANFVASLDGIVAIPEVPKSSAIVSGGSPADRFLVALLRATADAVVIGAGTFRAHAGPWTAAKAYPDAAADFAEVRRRLGLAEQPRLVVVTASGRLDGAAAKLRGAMIATTVAGADQARRHAGPDAEVVVVETPDGPLDPVAVFAMLADLGHRRVLTEGGPNLMGQLVQARVIDELFLTVSPLLTGGGKEPRPTLAEGVDLLPGGPIPARLVSARAHASHLFLRYLLDSQQTPAR